MSCKIKSAFSVVLVLIMALMFACGSDDADTYDDDDDNSDGDEQSDGDSDTELAVIDGDLEPELEAELEVEIVFDQDEYSVFELLPDEPSTQIHASLASDGEGIWLVYNIPDANKTFDVYAARLKADASGEYLVEPFKVNTTDFNEIDPDVAVSGDKVLFVWQSDNSGSARNLDVFYRVYGTDGSELMDSDRHMDLKRDGQLGDFNAWMAQASAQSDGGFAVIGSWAPDDVSAWQAFVQKIDSEGELAGDVIESSFQPDTSQVYADIAGTVSGGLHLAWARNSVELDDRVAYTFLEQDAIEGDPNPAGDAIEGMDGSGSALIADLQDESRSYLAFNTAISSSSNIMLFNIADEDSPQLRLGSLGKVNHTPALSLGVSGGGVAWYQVHSGIKNNVFAQGFVEGENGVTGNGVSVQVNDESGYGAPYALANTHVAEDYYLVVWSQGISPDFKLFGRFVKL